MDSWSENRNKTSSASKAAKLEKIGQINAVLRMLANDEDLQADLKTKDVTTAVKHWTNQYRLSHEEASKLQENRRVVYVLQKLQVLQHVCKGAGIAVPLDHLMSGQKELSHDFIVKMFGSEFELSQSGNSSKSSVSIAKKEKKQESSADSAAGANTVTNPDKQTETVVTDNSSDGDASAISGASTPEVVAAPVPAPELTEKQKRILAERLFVRRMQEGTILLVILVCVVLKWFYDK